MFVFLVFATQLAAQAPSAAAPAEAVDAARTDATVTLDCLADGRGRLSDCRVVAEEPPGQGFGEAALAGATRARMAPRTSRTRGAGRVRFTVRFAAAPNP